MKAFTSDQILLVENLWRATVEKLLPIAKLASTGISYGKKPPEKSYLIDKILRIIGDDPPPQRNRTPQDEGRRRLVEAALVEANLAQAHHFER